MRLPQTIKGWAILVAIGFLIWRLFPLVVFVVFLSCFYLFVQFPGENYRLRIEAEQDKACTDLGIKLPPGWHADNYEPCVSVLRPRREP